MGNKIVACPTCGALGEIGAKCPFCEGLIVSNDEEKTIKGRIPRVKTVSAELFAERISKYSSVSPFKNGLAVVGIGSLEGLINKNGDIIIPISYEHIIYDKQWALLLDDGFYSLYNMEEGKFYDLSIKKPKDGEYQYENHFDKMVVCNGWDNQIVLYLNRTYSKRIKGELKETWNQESFVFDIVENKIVFQTGFDLAYEIEHDESPEIYGLYTCSYSDIVFDMSGNKYRGRLKKNGENDYSCSVSFWVEDTAILLKKAISFKLDPSLEGKALTDAVVSQLVSFNEAVDKEAHQLKQKHEEEWEKKRLLAGNDKKSSTNIEVDGNQQQSNKSLIIAIIAVIAIIIFVLAACLS